MGMLAADGEEFCPRRELHGGDLDELRLRLPDASEQAPELVLKLSQVEQCDTAIADGVRRHIHEMGLRQRDVGQPAHSLTDPEEPTCPSQIH
jgi:hypothetical protein